jgi:hypothetical protein
MTQTNQEYILGRNVTERARAQENRGTVVLSLRLSSVEFDMLSDLAESQGRTVSQVAREAIQVSFKHRNRETYSADLSLSNGSAFTFGDMSNRTSQSVQINQDNQETIILVGA